MGNQHRSFDWYNTVPHDLPFPQMVVNNAPILVCNFEWQFISATGDPIHFMFGYRVQFSGTPDRMALFPCR